MSNTTLVLADGTAITLEAGASLADTRTQYPDRASMAADWEKLTAANLKTVQIVTDNMETGRYADLLLESETSVVAQDGTVTTSWHLRQKTETELLREETELLREEVETLKAGQGVQDGAIEDLGAMTSTIAEQLEGGVQ